MKVKYGGVALDATGKLGGIVASHNRGGAYFRRRGTPTNPNTFPQTAARVALAISVNSWGTVLTPGQREAWGNFAQANPKTNGFGQAVNIGGLGWFVALNSVRLRAALAPVLDPPLTPAPATLGDVGAVTLTASTDVLSFVITSVGDWAGQDDGALLLFASKGQSPTRVSSAGIPLTLCDVIPGSSSSAPTSPFQCALPFNVVAGQAVFWRLLAVDETGRVSTQTRGRAVAA